MANAGIASRRECEAIIAAGRVTVNDKVVTQMGVKVDPQRDQIKVDGELIKPRLTPARRYIMLYKPVGYLSVFDDERGRPGLEALVSSDDRMFPVGRLDADSEGLLLLTNDGEMAQRLSHPRYEHAKTYVVLVDHFPGMDTLNRFRRGMELEDGATAPSEWRPLDRPPVVPPPEDPAAAEGVWLQVTLREGRKRQIRRMCAAEHLYVRRLIRVSQGPLQLDPKLQPGASRPLRNSEVQSLRSVTRDKPAGGTAKAQPVPARGAAAVSRRAALGPSEKPAPRRASSGARPRPTGDQPPPDRDERPAPRRGPSGGGSRSVPRRRPQESDRSRPSSARSDSRSGGRSAPRGRPEDAGRRPAAGPAQESRSEERRTPRRRPADSGSASAAGRGPAGESQRPASGRPPAGASRKPSRGGTSTGPGGRSAPRRAPRDSGARDTSRSGAGRSEQRSSSKTKKQSPRKP